MTSLQPDHKKILQDEFDRRRDRNASYSLRSFARDVGLSPGSVSKILSGQQGLSLLAAKKVAKALDLSQIETKLFCVAVESQHARSKLGRERAQKELLTEGVRSADLSIDYFKTIADWYYPAILELPEVKGFQSNPVWIAERLGISETVAKDAIQRLLKLELLEESKSGKLKKSSGYLKTPSDIPSRSFRNHHAQLLKKAEEALETQTVTQRDFSAVTFSMNTEDMHWAKTELKKFRAELTHRLSASKDKDRLYQLTLELFALDQVKKEK